MIDLNDIEHRLSVDYSGGLLSSILALPKTEIEAFIRAVRAAMKLSDIADAGLVRDSDWDELEAALAPFRVAP